MKVNYTVTTHTVEYSEPTLLHEPPNHLLGSDGPEHTEVERLRQQVLKLTHALRRHVMAVERDRRDVWAYIDALEEQLNDALRE